MSLIDDIKNKAEEAVKNPDMQAKAEQFAKEHNISIEEAKNKLLNHDK